MAGEIPFQAGLSQNNLPYLRVGNGDETLVIFTSGSPDDRIPKGLMLKLFVDGAKNLAKNYQVYFLKRRQDLPHGFSTADMARDYAEMIDMEIGGPCHVIGISAGGFIAQQFAVHYPELVEKLVIAIAGYRLQGEGRGIVSSWRRMAKQGRIGPLMASMYRCAARSSLERAAATVGGYVVGLFLRRSVRDLGDFVITLEALLAHDGRDLLPRIQVPTLIIGGDEDVFYPREMLESMHSCVKDSKLILYPQVGHGALEFRKQEFDRDVLEFLAAPQ